MPDGSLYLTRNFWRNVTQSMGGVDTVPDLA
jgi:hypothetical protein